MTINGGIFSIQQVYNKQVSKTWPITAPRISTPVTNLSVIDEPGSVVINVNTFDYAGQTLYWTIQGVTGTVNSSDFSAISGSFVVQSNNFGTFTVTSLADVASEGPETFNIQIRTDSTSGTIRATSGTITINDTSIPSKNRAFFASGITSTTAAVSTRIDRIIFSNDTVTASNRSTMIGIYGHVGLGNFNVGYFAGGIFPGGNALNSILKYTFSNETTGSTGGFSAPGRRYLAATGNNDFGWIGGGITPASPGTTSTVNRLSYASDGTVATTRGPLILARHFLAATGNNNYGWFAGGLGPFSRIDRIDFADDTTTASSRGPLSLARDRLAAMGNNNYGWFATGFSIPSPSPTTVARSRVDRVDFSSDTTTASIRGTSPARITAAGVGNNDFGWIGGGLTTLLSTPGVIILAGVDRITYDSDTAASSSRGPLASARGYIAGVSGFV